MTTQHHSSLYRPIALLAMIGIVALSPSPIVAQAVPRYAVVDSIKIGDIDFEYYTLDPVGRRLYGAGNLVVDIDHDSIVGHIEDTAKVRGFQVVPDYGLGVSNRGAIFDTHTGAILTRVNADGRSSAYDPATRRVLLLHDTIAAVDVKRGEIVGRVAFPDAWEIGVTDGRGRFYFVLGHAATVVAIDTKSLQTIARWPLGDCQLPQGITMDRKTKRLFVGCQGLLEVVDSRNGNVVQRIAIPGHAAIENAFDPATRLLFMATGPADGLTILHEVSPDSLSIIQHITNEQVVGARVAVDPVTHRVFMARRDSNHIFYWIVLAPVK
jgi:hypothetical protein